MCKNTCASSKKKPMSPVNNAFAQALAGIKLD